MTLSYNFGQEDLLRWFRHSHESSSGGRMQRSRYVATWTGIYLGIAGLASLYFQAWPAVIMAFGLAAALSFATPKWYDRYVEQALVAHASDPKLAGGFGPHQLILSDAGIREITPVADSLVRWASVTEVVTEAEYIFVRLASGQAAVINRQSYSGPIPFEEIPKFIHELKQKHGA